MKPALNSLKNVILSMIIVIVPWVIYLVSLKIVIQITRNYELRWAILRDYPYLIAISVLALITSIWCNRKPKKR